MLGLAEKSPPLVCRPSLFPSPWLRISFIQQVCDLLSLLSSTWLPARSTGSSAPAASRAAPAIFHRKWSSDLCKPRTSLKRRSSFPTTTSSDPLDICSFILHRYTFSASACGSDDVCDLSPVTGNAAVQVGAAFYGPSGEAICDGQVSCKALCLTSCQIMLTSFVGTSS